MIHFNAKELVDHLEPFNDEDPTEEWEFEGPTTEIVFDSSMSEPETEAEPEEEVS